MYCTLVQDLYIFVQFCTICTNLDRNVQVLYRNVMNVQKCTKMYKDVQRCTNMYKNVQTLYRMDRNVQKCVEKRILLYISFTAICIGVDKHEKCSETGFELQRIAL